MKTKTLTILGTTILLISGSVLFTRQAVAEQKTAVVSTILSKLASLNITDTQKEQIRSIVRDHREKVIPMIQEYVTAQRSLGDAVRSSPIDEAAIRSKSLAVAQQQGDLAVELAYISQEIRSVLTPEQIEKVDAFLNERGIRINNILDNILDRIGKRITD